MFSEPRFHAPGDSPDAAIPEEVWRAIEPLLAAAPQPSRGRPRLSDRAALGGILYVLRTGIPWERMPRELGCGAGMTCLRRLRHWQRNGTWQKLQPLLVRRLPDGKKIDWARSGTR